MVLVEQRFELEFAVCLPDLEREFIRVYRIVLVIGCITVKVISGSKFQLVLLVEVPSPFY